MSDVESDVESDWEDDPLVGEEQGGESDAGGDTPVGDWAPWENDLLTYATGAFQDKNGQVQWGSAMPYMQERGFRRTQVQARHRHGRIKKGRSVPRTKKSQKCKRCGQFRRGHTCRAPQPPAANAAASSSAPSLSTGPTATAEHAPAPPASRPITPMPITPLGDASRAAARPTTPTHHAWNGHRANLRDDVPQSPPAPPGSPANFGDAPLAAPTPAAAFSETPTAAAGRAPAPPRSSTSGGAARASSPAFNGPPAAPSAGTLVDGAATHVPPQKAPAPAKAAELDTVAEAPMTSPVTVQDVMNRPSPPHEPFAEQARGAPIEDEFEQHWNATETSETHFFTDGTWLPKYI